VIYVVYVWFCAIIGIVWGITKQIVTDVIDFSASGNIPNFGEIILTIQLTVSNLASGNIPNFGEISLNIHLTASNYLYNVLLVHLAQENLLLHISFSAL